MFQLALPVKKEKKGEIFFLFWNLAFQDPKGFLIC